MVKLIIKESISERKSKGTRKFLPQECNSIQDVQELLKSLFKGTVEEMLEAEMDEHLGYGNHSPSG